MQARVKWQNNLTKNQDFWQEKCRKAPWNFRVTRQLKKNRRRNANKVEAADKEWLYMYAENISVWQNIIEFRGPLVPRTV